MRWTVTGRADPAGAKIADRHYNRHKIGSKQFVPPGRCVVLVIPSVALWVTSWPFAEYVRHDWPGAWVNSTFRNESGTTHLSSELIREAIAATRWIWPDAPAPHGLITFVAPSKVKRKRDPGRCYIRAGFHQVFTYDYGANRRRVPRTTLTDGHLVFQMLPEDMPAAAPPLGSNVDLFARLG